MFTLDSDMHIFDGEIGIRKRKRAGVATLACLLVLRNSLLHNYVSPLVGYVTENFEGGLKSSSSPDVSLRIWNLFFHEV